MEENSFIHRCGANTDSSYIDWIKDLKLRFRSAQQKAIRQVNSAMLAYYWSLGRDIVIMKADSKWGDDFFNQLSLDLKDSFPEEKGFSVTNLKYMKRWYQFYLQSITNRQQLADENQHSLEMPDKFGLIPWFHHVQIFTKAQSHEEAEFYIDKTIEGNWSRNRLTNEMKDNLFEKQGKAITNFKDKLPTAQGELAQEILKDPYNFEFLTLDKNYDEIALEKALVSNITNFLLELGNGFAFVGRQMELRLSSGKSFFPDLLFYHIKLKCYVVIELKVVEYIPEFAGKLNFYVNAVDNLLRGEGDNQTIGLIICQSSDKTVVEWSLNGIEKPLGVATYQLKEIVEKTIKEIKN